MALWPRGGAELERAEEVAPDRYLEQRASWWAELERRGLILYDKAKRVVVVTGEARRAIERREGLRDPMAPPVASS